MSKKINYDGWSKEELVNELRRIKDIRYGLVWHRDLTKETIDILVNPDATVPSEMFPNEMKGKPFPVLKEEKSKEIITDKSKPVNLLIEGDNYHSLAVLSFTHNNSIDVIYIDPPYNTGNKDFKYNDQWIDKEDSYRHSKWLSFMEKRLKLAKGLLSDKGIIFISIDDNEQAQLKLLCDEVFGDKNFIAIVPRLTKKGGKGGYGNAWSDFWFGSRGYTFNRQFFCFIGGQQNRFTGAQNFRVRNSGTIMGLRGTCPWSRVKKPSSDAI